jgi:hypothetical protein
MTTQHEMEKETSMTPTSKESASDREIAPNYAQLQVGMGLAGSPITLDYAYLS